MYKVRQDVKALRHAQNGQRFVNAILELKLLKNVTVIPVTS